MNVYFACRVFNMYICTVFICNTLSQPDKTSNLCTARHLVSVTTSLSKCRDYPTTNWLQLGAAQTLREVGKGGRGDRAKPQRERERGKDLGCFLSLTSSYVSANFLGRTLWEKLHFQKAKKAHFTQSSSLGLLIVEKSGGRRWSKWILGHSPS